MPSPGDYEPAPDIGPTAIRLVGPDACGQCGALFGRRDSEGWHYSFSRCGCQGGENGHHSWSHACGWSLTVPPHEAGYMRQVY